MNLKQCKYVMTLSQEGSFSRAAETLNISQPSLSQYIKNIEKELDIELFERSGGFVRLTDAGNIYIEAGRKILDIEHQMQNRLSDIAENKTGSVVIGTSPYRSASMMPMIAKAFQKVHPGMHIVVEEMTSNELIEDAEHGKFDLCLTLMPVDKRIFSYEKIAEEEIVLAVPTSFPEMNAEKTSCRKYPAIDARELDGCSYVSITESQVMQKTLENICRDYGISVEKAAVVKSLEAQIAMVRAGVGMALVPTGIETFCSGDEVRFYSFKQELPRREVVAMWKKNRALSQATQELLEIIKNI
ncbi:MAG: LysR family transcriptional regulator [Clostridiales bacterium]|nr:LysR family transcriptional regulator [Candidatus Crickella caballi]